MAADFVTHKMLHSVARRGEKVEQEVPTKATTDRRSLEEAVGDRFQVGVGVSHAVLTNPEDAALILRSRTMALLSDATVIVETADGSGSLHQGWEAIRLGRGLFISKATAKIHRGHDGSGIV